MCLLSDNPLHLDVRHDAEEKICRYFCFNATKYSFNVDDAK